MLREMLVHSLLISFCVPYYQPSCYNSFDLTVFFKSTASKILLQRWKQGLIYGWRIYKYSVFERAIIW